MEEEESAVRSYWEEKGEPIQEDGEARHRLLARRAGKAVQKAVGTGKERVSNLSPTGRVIAGTALLGVAAGIVLGAYLRKR